MLKEADTKIAERIFAAMADDEHLGSLEIQLQVRDGVATMRGLVDSAMQRRQAEEAALVGGAIAVTNELEVSGEPIAGTARRRTRD